MAKRPCFSDHPPRVTKPDYAIDELWEALFSVSDSALIDASLDGFVESKSTDYDQSEFIQRAFHLGSIFLEAAKRCARKHSSVHNASVWPLPTDLTIKVFSKLDSPSVCSAATTCVFFEKCVMDPLCYANIDLPTLVPKVNDAVLSTLIQRAGNALQSIKLGVLRSNTIRQGHGSSILTSSCLSSLSANGSHLRKLHLYNIEQMDNKALLASLSVCPSLVDLEIVCWDVDISPTLESVSRHCPLIERFVFEPLDLYKEDFLEYLACKEFVLNCPKINTLVLKGCELHDCNAVWLVKGFQDLKYVDFSLSYCFDGSFLKNLGTKSGGGINLEVMILRECIDLCKVNVEQFIETLLAGKCSPLRHLDVSDRDGLASYDESGYVDRDRYSDLSSILIKKLLEQRPNFCLVAEFPDLKLSSHASDVSLSTSTSGCSSDSDYE